MSLYDDISNVKDRHAQILAELSTLENASDTLRSHDAFLSDLQEHLANADRELAQIHKRTQVGRERHEKYRDSTMRRLVYRATGKRDQFEEKADEEMRSYYNALERENKIRAQRDMLEAQRREATEEKAGLEEACTRRVKLKAELDAMYERLFSGPTAEFPEEDEQEEAVKAAKSHHQTLSKNLNGHRKALQCLARAQVTTKEALLFVFEARKACERDMLGFGGTLADFRRANSLSNAQQKVSQTQMLVDQARRLDPDIPHLPPMDIVQIDMISGILCDNFVFNMNYLNMIYHSFDQVKVAEEFLASVFRSAKRREEHLKNEVEDTAGDLEMAQRELRKVREEAFIKAADPPPPYAEKSREAIAVDQ
ncbi:hypothetical protein ASPCAL06014 [Aspergillus calidoustus]|uniref:Uncharacterized protein n=1 Tax=Aspergillus calidoustus TaxID=454130 RepID=A0A0U5C844_ASPCI|nr:hypothetical protein ASPCAL06014 [Aspergillus calidoustus]